MKNLLILATCAGGALGFAPSHPTPMALSRTAPSNLSRQSLPSSRLQSTPEPTNEASASSGSGEDAPVKLTAEEEENVGNLVADEEWVGLSMELADVVRTAVVEDLKKNSRDFLEKDEYAIGDFSKKIDEKVKEEVAKMRGKDDYELGDLSVIMDEKVKEMVCELSGKDDYEFGDLSVEIDARVKSSVAEFCGKDSYQVGEFGIWL